MSLWTCACGMRLYADVTPGHRSPVDVPCFECRAVGKWKPGGASPRAKLAELNEARRPRKARR